MGRGVLVIAESGSGKSTSIENLNPAETFIINVANKPLPFKGWKSKYVAWSKETPKGNIINRHDAESIEACIKYVNEKRPEITTIVIDDFQYVSSFEFFDKINEKGYDKFTQIGSKLSKLSRLPQTLRDDLTVFYLTHAEESVDIEGKRKVKAKTIGKLIDEKLTLEGLFSIVLFGKVKKNKDGADLRYVFETQTTGDNTCKSPRGMFLTSEVPNDLELVRKAIIDYEN